MSHQNLEATERCRGRITIEHVARAVAALEAMDLSRKEQLAGELARQQPALFASFLAQHKLGVSYEKMEFLLSILFVCYLATRESGLQWAAISEDEMDACMVRYVESVKFGQALEPAQQKELVQQFVEGHPEQVLLAYVQTETADWLRRVTPEESDRFVMLAAVNVVNCIGYAQSTVSEPHDPPTMHTR